MYSITRYVGNDYIISYLDYTWYLPIFYWYRHKPNKNCPGTMISMGCDNRMKSKLNKAQCNIYHGRAIAWQLILWLGRLSRSITLAVVPLIQLADKGKVIQLSLLVQHNRKGSNDLWIAAFKAIGCMWRLCEVVSWFLHC